jgi:hypothetical protein
MSRTVRSLGDLALQRLFELRICVESWETEGLGTCRGLAKTNYPDAWDEVCDLIKLPLRTDVTGWTPEDFGL